MGWEGREEGALIMRVWSWVGSVCWGRRWIVVVRGSFSFFCVVYDGGV